jgi:hypothetical protein
MMGIPYDTKKPYTKTKECHLCGETFKKHETLKSGAVIKLKIYDDPWASEPSNVRVHAANEDNYGSCLDKLTDPSWGDFGYFVCADCGRTIIRQCPYNGWRSYVKIVDDYEEICVACYQANVLTNGMDRESFERGTIPGDFFDEKELSNYDWSLVQGKDSIRIADSDSAKKLCAEIIEIMDKGYKALINYDSMAIGGSEGYVSVYYK